MRGKKASLRRIQPDPKFDSVLVARLINQVMREGKKSVARKVVYGAFDIIEHQNKQKPIEILEKAIENAAPLLEVKSRRIGGATYQVPREVRGDRKVTLALRWILLAVRKAKGKPSDQKLASELMNAAKNEGSAIKKKEDTHRMAEANRAFAHFAW